MSQIAPRERKGRWGRGRGEVKGGGRRDTSLDISGGNVSDAICRRISPLARE